MQFAEEYVYDLDDARRGLIVHELVPEMHTSGPAKCYRERANDDYTGYTVWAASVLLSRWIIEHRDDFAGQRVIELGAGCGLSGLAAAACTTAERVVLSDYPRSTMENLLYNVARNCERVAAGADAEALGGAAPPRGVGGGEPDHLVATLGGAGGPTFTGRDAFRAPSGCLMLLAQLDWDDAATWPREAGGGGAFATFDVILASDLFYRRSYARKVASAALQLLRPGGRLVCVTPTGAWRFGGAGGWTARTIVPAATRRNRRSLTATRAATPAYAHAPPTPRHRRAQRARGCPCSSA